MSRKACAAFLTLLAAPLAWADLVQSQMQQPGMAVFIASVSASGSCDRHATSASSLANQFGAATPGQTICLASGNYGTFRGGAKSGRVTVKPKSGASVAISINFSSARNITMDGMTISELNMSGSRDITISNNRFNGQAIVHAGKIPDANIVFDSNKHINVSETSSYPGMVHVDQEGQAETGVTIRNSLFDGGFLDGVRADANGIVIEGNEFRNMTDRDPYHTDPIQIYGGKRIIIRRNFFHNNNVPAHIGAWDGNDHNVIEDNVFGASSGLGVSIALYLDNGSIIRHNTLQQGACNWGWKCGILALEFDPSIPSSVGTVVKDNILSEISGRDRLKNGEISNNLFTGTQTPMYAGPLTTYEGFRLAPGSPGKSGASDGLDIGIR